MMNDNVKKLLKESMWDLATCSNGEPNVVPVAFKDVTEDGKLVVGDRSLKKAILFHVADFGRFRMLGHVSAAATLDIYTHIIDDMRQAVAANIDRGIIKAAEENH
jgi:hypothetical protein